MYLHISLGLSTKYFDNSRSMLFYRNMCIQDLKYRNCKMNDYVCRMRFLLKKIFNFDPEKENKTDEETVEAQLGRIKRLSGCMLFANIYAKIFIHHFYFRIFYGLSDI